MKRILARHGSLPGLQVVPVVRGRLAFAQAALDAIEAEQPDFIAVDLPGVLNGSDWLETVLSRLPLATSMVVKRSGDCLLLPFTPSDACTIAAWRARRTALPFACVDNFTYIAKQRDRTFGPRSGISATPVLPSDLTAYFEPAWSNMSRGCVKLWCARTSLARGAGIARELGRICGEHRRVLLVADYRTWWAVRKFLDRPLRISPPPLRGDVHAALLFEDALALWHAGLSEMPGLVREFFRAAEAGERFDPAGAIAQALDLHADIAAALPPEERNSAALLDVIEESAGHSAAAAAAARLLSYPAPTCGDAADRIPAFATITAHGIGPRYWMFDPPDVFECAPFYEPSAAETAAFFPDAEPANRAGWGPTPTPYVTRSEAARVLPSRDVRWSADGNAAHIAEAAALARRYVVGLPLDPPLPDLPDLHTPVVFIWTNESDGDVRTVDDSNVTRRRLQFGELREDQPIPEGCPAPDTIHTLCATRSLNADWWLPMVQYDFAASIATLYSGPETGPARYDAVVAHNPEARICRQNPAHDPDLEGLPRDQVAAAFAVKWASDLVIVVAHAAWSSSEALTRLASGRSVRLVIVPLSVVPATKQIRLRRRVFVDRQMRMDGGAGRRLENRFAEWRLQPLPGQASALV